MDPNAKLLHNQEEPYPNPEGLLENYIISQWLDQIFHLLLVLWVNL